ncbi:hypothetical protein [Microbacterium kunmingense]|uniref:hypothetical protein n=1 Tax=Microbacterium kunmingense TaxID=2915939 RepID=UPI003D704DF4
MTVVKLASSLPKEHESNGLEANSRHLIAAYQTQNTIPVVALVRTKDCTDTEEFVRVPRIEIVHIEGAFNDDDADAVRSLLVSLHDDRVRHRREPLDLPDVDADVNADGDGPLQIEAADIVDAELIDDDLVTTGKDA